MPNLLQDLRNVGMTAEDMSPLFLSAERFAQVWVKTLQGAAEIGKPRLKIYVRDNSSSLKAASTGLLLRPHPAFARTFFRVRRT